MEKLEQLILDEGRKEKRERTLLPGQTMTEQEYENTDGAKLQEVLADGLKEKLYGKVVRRIYPTEADGMFERFGESKATVDDLKKFNVARYQLERDMAQADILRAGMGEDDVEFLSAGSEEFDAIIGGTLKDKKRVVDVVRDHFYLMVADGRTDDVKAILDAQRELKKVRESPSFARSNAIAKQIIDEHGFTTKEWSKIEEAHTTQKELEEYEQQARGGFRKWSFKGVLDQIFHGSGFSPSERGAKRKIRGKEEVARESIRKHFIDKGVYYYNRRTRKVLRQIAKIEDARPMGQLKEQYNIIGSILAASVENDEKLMEALQIEEKSQGKIKAEAVDRTKPVTFEELGSKKGELNDGTFKTEFKKYIKKRVEGGSLTAADLADDGVRGTELERYNRESGAPKKGVFGFFVELLDAFRRTWLTNDKKSSFIKDNNLWNLA